MWKTLPILTPTIELVLVKLQTLLISQAHTKVIQPYDASIYIEAEADYTSSFRSSIYDGQFIDDLSSYSIEQLQNRFSRNHLILKENFEFILITHEDLL